MCLYVPTCKHSAVILAFINQKGGVGKTTTVVSTAAVLAEGGKRVLVVDLDPQAFASTSLGVPRSELEPSLAGVLLDGEDASKAVHELELFDGRLHVLTGSMDLASADLLLGSRRGREWLVDDALRPLEDRYDVLLVDCPPSLSLLTVGALLASDGYVVPVVPEHLALEGLVNLFGAVDRVDESIDKPARLLGILLTMVDRRRGITDGIIGLLRGHYKKQVFTAEIPENVRLAEAPGHGRPITLYARRSRGAQAYQAFASELMRRSTVLR